MTDALGAYVEYGYLSCEETAEYLVVSAKIVP